MHDCSYPSTHSFAVKVTWIPVFMELDVVSARARRALAAPMDQRLGMSQRRLHAPAALLQSALCLLQVEHLAQHTQAAMDGDSAAAQSWSPRSIHSVSIKKLGACCSRRSPRFCHRIVPGDWPSCSDAHGAYLHSQPDLAAATQGMQRRCQRSGLVVASGAVAVYVITKQLACVCTVMRRSPGGLIHPVDTDIAE